MPTKQGPRMQETLETVIVEIDRAKPGKVRKMETPELLGNYFQIRGELKW